MAKIRNMIPTPGRMLAQDFSLPCKTILLEPTYSPEYPEQQRYADPANEEADRDIPNCPAIPLQP